MTINDEHERREREGKITVYITIAPYIDDTSSLTEGTEGN